MQRQSRGQSGQIALAILLIMAVVLVIALAVAKRTTREVSQTTQTGEAAQAFAAAESAAELRLNTVVDSLQAGKVPANVTLGSPETQGNLLIDSSIEGQTVLDQTLAAGESTQVSLNNEDGASYDGQVTITWQSVDSELPSLIISKFYRSAPGAPLNVSYFLVSSCGAPDRGDGFSPPTSCISDGSQQTLLVDTNTAFLRIQSVYAAADISVAGANTLPPQEYLIRSQVYSDGPDTQENAAVEVTASNLLPPPFLDYALYSGGSLVKN